MTTWRANGRRRNTTRSDGGHLRTELDAVATRHRDGKALFDCMGRFAPAFGMIGTLMGLVIMLGDMSDPSKIGAGMAVALLTTMYGAIAANVVFLPFAEKLGFTNRQELLMMEIAIRGIMAIQSGENPRGHRAESSIRSFHPRQRTTDEAAEEALATENVAIEV